ncbi:MAG: NAD(P)-dependent oxidoreductase [Actinomycetia bacterium]|nr:NAD(P)-dependent oxidoreductase [Actinomycetes bacterium]
MTDVLVLHPGSMGGVVAADLARAGHQPHWVSADRSPATTERAEQAGSLGHPDLASAIEACAVILSICPPDNALEIAAAVAEAASATGSTPLFVDANAIAPVTMRAVATAVAPSGCPVVDGGIVGPPPVAGGSTRLYLAGDRADEVAELFRGAHTEPVVVEGEIGAASALKMTYAAWTKGSSALLLTIAAAARAHGVEDALTAEWARSQPELEIRLRRSAAGSAPKAWRWKGEMEEIAATMAEKGLPAGFHLAAAETWRRLTDFKDQDPPPELEAVLDRHLEG